MKASTSTPKIRRKEGKERESLRKERKEIEMTTWMGRNEDCLMLVYEATFFWQSGFYSFLSSDTNQDIMGLWFPKKWTNSQVLVH